MKAAEILKLVVSILRALLRFIDDNDHAHELTEEARRKDAPNKP